MSTLEAFNGSFRASAFLIDARVVECVLLNGTAAITARTATSNCSMGRMAVLSETLCGRLRCRTKLERAGPLEGLCRIPMLHGPGLAPRRSWCLTSPSGRVRADVRELPDEVSSKGWRLPSLPRMGGPGEGSVPFELF
jgi:hypothetical protein